MAILRFSPFVSPINVNRSIFEISSPKKIRSLLASELLVGSNNFGGAKMVLTCTYRHAKFGGDPGGNGKVRSFLYMFTMLVMLEPEPEHRIDARSP